MKKISDKENNKSELKKHLAKRDKAVGTAIVVADEKNTYYYKAYYFAKVVNGKIIHAPISMMLEKHRPELEKGVITVIGKLKKGERIINTELKDVITELSMKFTLTGCLLTTLKSKS